MTRPGGRVHAWWRLSVASFRMLYRDGQVLLIAFLLPLLFLSGVFLPVSTLPAGVREAVTFLPLTPLTDLMRAALLDVPPAGDPVTAALVLAGETAPVPGAAGPGRAVAGRLVEVAGRPPATVGLLTGRSLAGYAGYLAAHGSPRPWCR